MSTIIEEIAETLVTYIKLSLLDAAPNLAPSRLFKSIDYEVSGEDVNLIMNEYWRYVENGRGPGKPPPMMAILEWIQRYKIKSRDGLSDTQLAFAIANAIARRGIRPRPFLQQGINEGLIAAEPLIDRYINNRLNEAFEE